ncbi:TPA: BspA family leucine-rich repeat surface protein, partial [Enterococcus faecium]
STTDSSASSQEGATSQNLEVIEEAPAHEEEEKKTALRGGQVTNWTYTESGTTITLTGYTGSSTDVVIPTARDLGFNESYTAQISANVLSNISRNKRSLSTSTNGKKIVVNSTSLRNCFMNNSTLNTIDLDNLDTSNVTNMYCMFLGCFYSTSLNISLDISNWNTSKVTNMGSMFSSCKLTSLDISNWDTSNVTNMYYMFNDCNKLTSLDVSNWDTSNVTNMERILPNKSGCKSF